MADFPTTIIKTKTGETDLSEFLVQLNFNNGIIKTEEGKPLDLNQIKLKTNDGETVVWNKPLAITIEPSFNGVAIDADVFKDGVLIHSGKIGSSPYIINAKYGSTIKVLAHTSTRNTILYPGSNSWNHGGGLNGWTINDQDMTKLTYEKKYTSIESAKEKIILPALLERATNDTALQPGQSNIYYKEGNFAVYTDRVLAPFKGLRCEQRYAGFIWYEYYESNFIGVFFKGKAQPLHKLEGEWFSECGTYGFLCKNSGPRQPGQKALKVNYGDMKGSDGSDPQVGDRLYTIFHDGPRIKYRPFKLDAQNFWSLMPM